MSLGPLYVFLGEVSVQAFKKKSKIILIEVKLSPFLPWCVPTPPWKQSYYLFLMYYSAFLKKKETGGREKGCSPGWECWGGSLLRHLLLVLRPPSAFLWGSKSFTNSANRYFFWLCVSSIRLYPGVQTRLCSHVASDLEGKQVVTMWGGLVGTAPAGQSLAPLCSWRRDGERKVSLLTAFLLCIYA